MKNYSRLIDDYLMGYLSPEDKKEFEKELTINSSLQEEVRLCRELKETISHDDISSLREVLNRSHKEYCRNRAKKRYRLIPLSAAASILIIIAVRFMFINGMPNYEKLYQKHFQPYQFVGETRDSYETKSTFLSAELIRLYYNKDYDAVLPVLESYIARYPDDYQAKLMLVTALLETNNAEEAEKILRQLMEDDKSILNQEIIQWHLALSLLRQGKIEEVKQALEQIANDGGLYSQNARSILHTLEE